MTNQSRYYEATSPFFCEGKKQFVAVEDQLQTVRRRMSKSGEVLDELICPISRCGCAIEEIAASASGNWVVTRRNSGQGEWGYDVFRSSPLSREAGIAQERGMMVEIPKFAKDESRIVGGFGKHWVGGWWAHEDDDFEAPARGGPVSFGFLIVHHLPSHRLDRHELRIDLPRGWFPEKPEDAIWHGARSIVPKTGSISMGLYGGLEFKILEPLPAIILLPTPHPNGRKLL